MTFIKKIRDNLYILNVYLILNCDECCFFEARKVFLVINLRKLTHMDNGQNNLLIAFLANEFSTSENRIIILSETKKFMISLLIETHSNPVSVIENNVKFKKQLGFFPLYRHLQ
ncbi:hypothetical protein EDEG_03381 [Edhazardia aedis USNM 41457]|uniref:Uncharacterized protein n=1 Tax=Edhazardia aedis (strain USNM 41457) TaxID=1003232 RepID=J9DHU2_EDHAE|nr:hypothetical protein EDEG_03381 [Edhazardia aedis USNM 41457]|eukprot:EJW02185.1 hypothetical protein EDEG_03381 [Edhazardia aedis USNM 41457]